MGEMAKISSGKASVSKGRIKAVETLKFGDAFVFKEKKIQSFNNILSSKFSKRRKEIQTKTEEK